MNPEVVGRNKEIRKEVRNKEVRIKTKHINRD